FDPLSFGNGCAQANSKIVGEMVAADGNGARVANQSTGIGDQFGGTSADVEQASTEVAFVLRKAGFGGSERLQNRVVDQNTGPIRGGNKILRSDHGRGDHVHVGFETLADHTDGVADAVVGVHDEFVRQDVEDFAIVGKIDIPGRVDRVA